MANHSFTIEIQSINVYKFRSLKYGASVVADGVNSLNLLPQVHEVSVYESVFEHLIRCELAVYDYIGLFTNFPLTGEEIVIITYHHVNDTVERRWVFTIDSITNISTEDKNRATSYIINCISIEALANALTTIQRSYTGVPSEIASNIIDQHIFARIETFYPSYRAPQISAENNGEESFTFVIPNLHPLAAIDMLLGLTYSEREDRYSYIFFQNYNGFNFKTIQALTQDPIKRLYADRNRYKYISDEVNDRSSQMNNEDRLIANLQFNKRHSSMQKLSMGYFNNNLFEIDIGQKAIHTTTTQRDENKIITISPYDFNTRAYNDWANSVVEGYEISNRTRYAVTIRPEYDNYFPIHMARNNWGKDLISRAALSQVDVSAVLTNIHDFIAGDMFYLEIPEFHGFEDLKTDDLVSGMYLITEVKRVIRIGSYQSTVLNLKKDSYNSSIDRSSRYATE